MGARLYNPVTGLFTSLDPIYGGNDTPYAYPNDPINKQDLSGKAWWSTALSVVSGVACIVGGPIACGVASAASVVASYIDRRRQGQSWKRAAAFAVGEGLAAKFLRPLRMIKIKPRRMAKGVAPRATPRRASRAKPLSRWQKSGPWNRGSSYSRVLRAHPVRATFRAGYSGGYSIGYSLYGSRPRKRR